MSLLFRLSRPKCALRAPSVRWFASAEPEKSKLKLAENFWETITVENSPSGNTVVKMLGSPIKTPKGQPLELQKHQSILANLIANEWGSLASLTLKNHHIPLTSLTARALDIDSTEREAVTEKLLNYIDTDALLVIAPEKDCNGELRAAQLKEYKPLVEEACEFWQISGLKALDTDVQLFGNYQTEETKSAIRSWIRKLTPWQFAALERATTVARSLIIGMNVVLQRRSVDELAHLANLEVWHQTQHWGEVEDTHDVEKVDIRRQLGAAALVAQPCLG